MMIPETVLAEPSLSDEMKVPLCVFTEKYGGGDRIRTYVGVSQRVYSPSPLTARAPLHIFFLQSGPREAQVASRTLGGLPRRNVQTLRFRTMELVEGVEPATARLQGECSTVELHQPGAADPQDHPLRASGDANKPLIMFCNALTFQGPCVGKVFQKFVSIFGCEKVHVKRS